MSEFRTRNQLLLAEVQAAEGTEETPTVGANAVKTRFPIEYSPQFDSIETDYATGSLDASAPVTGGGFVGMAPACYLKGSGVGGTAPDNGVLLRGCGMEEVLTAADVTGTAQAGGASSITLAAGASAVDDAYVGMPIRITGGTGAGQVAVVTDYVGASKIATVTPAWTTQPDATSQYSIDANALYKPRSSGLELLTLWMYQHSSVSGNESRRRRLFDAAGSFSFSIAPRALAELRFAFRGRLPAAPDDVAHPGAPTFQSQDPQPFIGAQAYLGGAAVRFSAMSFDLGATVDQADNPSDGYGFDAAGVTGRRATGSITPSLVATATRNAFQDWLDSASKGLWLRWGSAAGKRVSIWIPTLVYTGNAPSDVRGYAGEALPFRAAGENSSIYLCFH